MLKVSPMFLELEDIQNLNDFFLRQLEVARPLLHRNVKRFRGGLVFKAHRLLYHLTLGLRAITKKKKFARPRSRIVELGVAWPF